MRQQYKIISIILLSSLVVFFFLSIYITVEENIPGNAVVVVTDEDKLYHSIHFDHDHDQSLGYFKGNRRFLFHHLLSKIGLQANSRWDRNGNWLW